VETLIARLLQDFEHGKLTRRQLIQSLTLAAAARLRRALPLLRMEKDSKRLGSIISPTWLPISKRPATSTPI
jgi:hypothetical protein